MLAFLSNAWANYRLATIGISLAVALGLGFTGYQGAKIWYNNQIEAAQLEGKKEAIEECNSQRLEEDIKLLEKELADAKAREETLSEGLKERERQNRNLQRFISGIDTNLTDQEDGDVSPRSKELVTILSERSRTLKEADNE